MLTTLFFALEIKFVLKLLKVIHGEFNGSGTTTTSRVSPYTSFVL